MGGWPETNNSYGGPTDGTNAFPGRKRQSSNNPQQAFISAQMSEIAMMKK